MEPAPLTMPRKRLHPIYVASLASCAGLAGCATRTSDGSLGSSEGGSTETSETTPSSDTADVAGGTDLGGASESDTSDVPDPFGDAAEKACAVYNGAQLPVMIPSGDPPYNESGFRLGDEFPHRFIVDTTSVPFTDQVGVPDGFVCYAVYPGQNEDEWWFSDFDWRDPDGEIRVFMATRGVSDVLYYSPIPGLPSIAPSIEFDATALCAELPRVWTPDPADLPEEGRRICILPTSDEAEFVFVRVP